MIRLNKTVFVAVFAALLICTGCASNPNAANAAGQALPGILMGIGAGLSGL